MSQSKTQQAIERARVRLRQAIDAACVARGEAQWLNGYRAGKLPANDDSLFAKEQLIWKRVGVVEKSMERAMRNYALAIRRSYDPIRRRGSARPSK